MSTRIKSLLLAAMKRAGKPLDSADLLDQTVGLGLAEAWPSHMLDVLSRRSVAQHLKAMAKQGLVKDVGPAYEPRAGRVTSMWKPVEPYDPAALVPAPPATADTMRPGKSIEIPEPWSNYSRAQLVALLETDDEIAGAVARFLADLRDVQQRARKRLTELDLDLDVGGDAS